MDANDPFLYRERGGRLNIGTEEEGGIEFMFQFEGRSVINKKRALYELLTADYIDPKRENAELPSMAPRLIFSQGSESEMVSRTFLTAQRLFNRKYLPDFINVDKALLLALDALREFGAMDKVADEYLEAEKSEIFQV